MFQGRLALLTNQLPTQSLIKLYTYGSNITAADSNSEIEVHGPP